MTKIIIPTERVNDLANALRLEMQEYGDLLNLLQELQQCLLGRDPKGIRDKNALLQKQLQKTTVYRDSRNEVAKVLRLLAEIDADASLYELIESLPQSMRPMFTALLEETNGLLERVRQKMHQNNLIMIRTQDCVDYILAEMDPDSPSKTYTQQGSAHLKGNRSGHCIQVSA